VENELRKLVKVGDEGNVYGSYPVARIWKYDPRKDETSTPGRKERSTTSFSKGKTRNYY
jgi:hypothetical protein